MEKQTSERSCAELKSTLGFSSGCGRSGSYSGLEYLGHFSLVHQPYPFLRKENLPAVIHPLVTFIIIPVLGGKMTTFIKNMLFRPHCIALETTSGPKSNYSLSINNFFHQCILVFKMQLASDVSFLTILGKVGCYLSQGIINSGAQCVECFLKQI